MARKWGPWRGRANHVEAPSVRPVGIDFHIGDHYFGVHVPTPLLLVIAVVALFVAFKLGRYVLAATGVWSN